MKKSRLPNVRGSLTELGSGDALELPYLCAPTVLLLDVSKPVQVQVSLDGQAYVPARDKDGVQVRLTQPGAYRMPVQALFVRLVSTADFTAQAFIGASHD